jgi:hypothetical protein
MIGRKFRWPGGGRWKLSNDIDPLARLVELPHSSCSWWLCTALLWRESCKHAVCCLCVCYISLISGLNTGTPKELVMTFTLCTSQWLYSAASHIWFILAPRLTNWDDNQQYWMQHNSWSWWRGSGFQWHPEHWSIVWASSRLVGLPHHSLYSWMFITLTSIVSDDETVWHEHIVKPCISKQNCPWQAEPEPAHVCTNRKR